MKLKADNLDVWCIELPDVPLTSKACLTLSDAEKSQATKFRFEWDRDRYLRSHVALRQLLGSYLDCAANQIRFARGKNGKPVICQQQGEIPFAFSLSHSADLAVIAIARGREVGVDAERVSPEFEWHPVAELLFTVREMNSIEILPEEKRAQQFFAFWVCKEAFLKARGEGISRATVAPEVVPPRSSRVSVHDGSCWSLHTFVPAPGYIGAVCSEGESSELNLCNWAWARRKHENRPIQ